MLMRRADSIKREELVLPPPLPFLSWRQGPLMSSSCHPFLRARRPSGTRA